MNLKHLINLDIKHIIEHQTEHEYPKVKHILQLSYIWWLFRFSICSRYFYKEGYEELQSNGEPQRQLSKEFVRKWLIENGFQGKEDQTVPEMPDEFVNLVSERYIELYEHITGEKFKKAESEEVLTGVERNIIESLRRLN